MTLLRDLWLWLWRLLPANPILVRVVNNGGKRLPHLWARIGYLSALILVFWIGGGFLKDSGSLADLAKQSTQTFMWVSMMQLALMSFIAPIFCAGAITQEKDSNTFHILLTTPLTNGQIVLGSLFSRLYFVWVLLLSGLPIFCITMIYGGVTTREVFESFGLAACTGLVTGTVAIMISFLKVGTRRTIFSFFVGVAVYLIGVGALGLSNWGQLAAAPAGTAAAFGTSNTYQMSWLAPIHPFLALMVVIGQTPAPPWSDVYSLGWPWRTLMAYPQYSYMAIRLLASIAMVLISLFYVRRGARDGESTIATRIKSLLRRDDGERRRTPRRVGTNPIAWREASTRASAGGKSAFRMLFIAAGIIAGIGLVILHYRGMWGLKPQFPDQTRAWVTVLTWIELAVVLLVVTSTAATTLTREKESQTIEILLTTPLTSKYIIYGMIEGLVRLVIPLIAVPTIMVLAFAIAQAFQPALPAVVAPEAVLLLPLQMIAFAALAATVGLHFSLTCKKTVQAVMWSTATVIGASGLMWGCGIALAQTGAMVNAFALPALPFPAMQALVNPWGAMGSPSYDFTSMAPRTFSDEEIAAFRITRSVTSLIWSAAVLGVAWAMINAMVRGFDMTVRKQAT